MKKSLLFTVPSFLISVFANFASYAQETAPASLEPLSGQWVMSAANPSNENKLCPWGEKNYNCVIGGINIKLGATGATATITTFVVVLNEIKKEPFACISTNEVESITIDTNTADAIDFHIGGDAYRYNPNTQTIQTQNSGPGLHLPFTKTNSEQNERFNYFNEHLPRKCFPNK